VIAQRSLWVISPVRDGLFFFASALVVFAAWAASALHVDPFLILAVVGVVSNGPHLISTWTRVYFDRREWKDHPVSIFVVPLLIVAAVGFAVASMGYTGSRLLNSVILYWATWHFVAQNWGILRIYQRKSGEPESSLALRLERPLLYLIVAWSLLLRLHTGPRQLFGVEIFHVVPPKALVQALLVPIGLLAISYVGLRVVSRHQPWGQSGFVRMGFLVCAFIGFFVPFRLITSDDTSAFAAAACWHGFQYLGMMRAYHRNAWADGVNEKARVISWLAQPGWGRAVLYALMLWALAGLVYGGIFLLSLVTPDNRWNFSTLGAVVWLSLTLSHYWLDGVIWKLRKPRIAQAVGVAV
jgi:hypothetical protein